MARIADEGASALTIRGIARDVGLSPAGMYRYYDSRDSLLTDLLVDAYSALADTVGAAAGLSPAGPADTDVLTMADAVPDPTRAMLAAIEAYRAWAVADPARFLLVFGTPVPGYAAPVDGPTVAANRRMGAVFFTLGALAWRDGRVRAPAGPAHRESTAEERTLLAQLHSIAPDLPADLIPRMLAGWALWHGLVTLEVTGQLQWAYPDTAAYYSETMGAWLDGFLAGR